MTAKCATAVIFDLDGTLYSLRAVKLRMTFRLLGSMGILKQMSGARESVRHRVFEDREALMGEFFRALGERARLSTSRARAWFEECFMVEFVAMLRDSGKVRPGLAPLLTTLGEGGIQLAVVSDFGQIGQRLEALGIDSGLFKDLVASEEHGALKPSPRPMLALAEKWDMDPEQVIVVGDRADLDEECARAAGMQFIGIRDGLGKRDSKYVDWTTASRELEARTGVGVSI